MAHSSSDILGIQSNSEILLYHKICQVISYHLSLEADEVLMIKLRLMKAIFDCHRKGKQGQDAAGKVAVLGLLKRQGKVFTVVV